MKKLFTIIFISVSTLTASAQGKNFIDQHYLEVAGNFDTLVVPDEIYIGITISENDSRDKQSVEEQESRMIAGLHALGIDVEKNLRSKDMTSNFRTYFLKGKEVIKTRHYILKVENAMAAGKVFKLLEDLNISNSQLYRVNLSNLHDVENLARSRAVENARLRALALVKPLGQQIGAAIFIADNENYYSGYKMERDTLAEVVVTDIKEEETRIDFEPMKITGNVIVRFELK